MSHPITPSFEKPERDAAAALLELALSEDLNDAGDLTTQALVAATQQAAVQVTARAAGVLAGGPVAEMVFARLHSGVQWTPLIPEGETLRPGDVIAHLQGPLQALLTGERTALNFLTHLSGIATLTRRFVEEVADTQAAIFDTRKTLPGFRLLEKYAVRAGGGQNHRRGLYDGMLIKDNHLAAVLAETPETTLADIIRRARQALPAGSALPVEIEVDTLAQLAEALAARPDIILLDNMTLALLREAVRLRDERAPQVQLEASGGVTLATVRDIAETGVDRISVGALTHSAPALDIALDWSSAIGAGQGG